MWWTLPWSRRGRRIGLARLVGEDGDEPPVAGIEIEVALGGDVEVRLLEDEGHAEHAFPEIDRGLPVGADQGDVVHPLRLQFLHHCLPPRRADPIAGGILAEGGKVARGGAEAGKAPCSGVREARSRGGVEAMQLAGFHPNLTALSTFTATVDGIVALNR